eukprot:scaffold76833_cov35-Attheya_sp.AAC.1
MRYGSGKNTRSYESSRPLSNWRTEVFKTKSTKIHAWLAYMTVYIPGTTYSSPTTSLTEDQCKSLQAIIKP